MNIRSTLTRIWTPVSGMNAVALAFLLLIATSKSAANTVPTKTAELCGVDEGQPPLKFVANFDGRAGWREYKSAKDIPTLELGTGIAAFYWPGRDGRSIVAVQEPGDDFDAYTHYCFNRSGHLIAMHFELRTAWGWGFREEGLIKQGKLIAKTSDYFETKHDQPIKRPDMADDISEALKPTLYLVKSKLPFAKLLSG